MTEKLRDLRALLKRTNVPLLSLRNHLGKEQVSPGAASAVVVTGKHLQALLVDTADAHQSEYVSAANKRREFLTGFTGSNGTGTYNDNSFLHTRGMGLTFVVLTAVVTHDKALLWTDGRYFLQAEQELSAEWTLMKAEEPGVPTIEVRTSMLCLLISHIERANNTLRSNGVRNN